MLTKEEKIELEEVLEKSAKYADRTLYESLSSKEDKLNWLNDLGKLTDRLLVLRLKEADLREDYILDDGTPIIGIKGIISDSGKAKKG